MCIIVNKLSIYNALHCIEAYAMLFTMHVQNAAVSNTKQSNAKFEARFALFKGAYQELKFLNTRLANL